MNDLKKLGWAIIILNGMIGPVVKLGLGYENAPWILVWPRMILALLAGAGLAALYLYERYTPPPRPEPRI